MTFKSPIMIKKNTEIEQLLQNNRKHISIDKEFKQDIYPSSSGLTKATPVRHNTLWIEVEK